MTRRRTVGRPFQGTWTRPRALSRARRQRHLLRPSRRISAAASAATVIITVDRQPAPASTQLHRHGGRTTVGHRTPGGRRKCGQGVRLLSSETVVSRVFLSTSKRFIYGGNSCCCCCCGELRLCVRRTLKKPPTDRTFGASTCDCRKIQKFLAKTA